MSDYHDDCSREVREELESRRREDRLEQLAESIRAQQQDSDDFPVDPIPLPLPGLIQIPLTISPTQDQTEICQPTS